MELELHILPKNYSSWSLRPWLLLVIAGAPFREVMHRPDQPAYRARLRADSPTGKVPVLKDGDLRVWESLAIAEHLAERFPEAELWPRDRVTRSWARAVSAEMHAGFAELRRQCPMNLARSAPHAIDPATRRDLTRFEDIVAEGRARFGQGGPFLCGAFSIADAMFAPVVTRILSYGLGVGPTTRAYVDAVRAHPAMDRWYREAAHELDDAPAFATTVTGPEVEPAVHPSAQVPPGACWAVIFASKLAPDHAGYAELATRMEQLAHRQPGFLGIESARSADGFGITVSYWDSLDAIAAFRAEKDHRAAQAEGRRRLYDHYDLRVARVERRMTLPKRG